MGLLFDRGTYGLRHHIPLSEDQMLEVRYEAEKTISDGSPGRQWHASEILEKVKHKIIGNIDGLDKYVLEITLAESTMLRSLGRMTWVAAGESDRGSRIEIHQAVVAIIQSAGRPLHTEEIKERLSATRGVNEFFQIQPVDPIIRLGSGLWGIKDRDATN